MDSFSISESLHFGWRAVKARPGVFVGIMIVFMGVSMLPAVVEWYLQDGDQVFAFLAMIPAWVIGMVVQLGLVLIPLRVCDGDVPEFSDLFACYDLVPRYILATIAYVLIVLAGILLLVVPGIVWGIKYQFYSYHIVDEGTGVIESLKRSGEITNGAKGGLWWLFLALLGINMVGFLCLFVGLLVTYAITLVVCAFVFRCLCDHVAGEVTQSNA